MVRSNTQPRVISVAVNEPSAAGIIDADRVLALLSAQAEGSMADFLSLDDHGQPVLDLAKAARNGKLGLIRTLRQRAAGWEIELYDAQAAAVQLGRHCRLFTDKMEASESGALTVEYVNDWR